MVKPLVCLLTPLGSLMDITTVNTRTMTSNLGDLMV